MDHCGRFCSPAHSADLSDLAEDNIARNSGDRDLGEGFALFIGWFDVKVCDIQEAVDRDQKLQSFIFGKRASTLGVRRAERLLPTG
jgi:hypothetical protein